MPRDTLAIWCYVRGSTGVEYGVRLDELNFTTVCPGGFGQLTCKLRGRDVRYVPPELQIFSQVAVMDGLTPVWLGRWHEPGIAMNDTDGEFRPLTAMGAGACLSDDPDDYSYSAQTAQAILQNQLSARAAYIPLSSDTAQILPDNPSGTFDRSYAGYAFERVLAELLGQLGNPYDYFTWEHPVNKDSSGYPAWQLYALLRDTTTVHYRAQEFQVIENDLRPSVDWTYNVVTVLYRDATTFRVGTVTVSDSRLAGGFAQGTAPYPMRRYRKDLSNLTLSSTQATALANAILNQFLNGGAKFTIKLSQVADGSGTVIPLHLVRAGKNIQVNQFAPVGNTLSVANTANQNLFFITQTQWEETQGGPTLTITGSTFPDTETYLVQRLQALAENSAQNTRVVVQPVNAANAPVKMRWGGQGDIVTNAHTFGPQLMFPVEMTNPPSTIAFSAVGSPTNVTGGPFTNNTDQFGSNCWTTGNAGQTAYAYTVTISGNCILDVDEEHGVWSHHCDVCEERSKRKHGCVGEVCGACYEAAVRRGIAREEIEVDGRFDNGEPGQVALGYKCARCGTKESWLPNSYGHDEDETHPTNDARRAEQIRLIRRVQRHLGHTLREHCNHPEGCEHCDRMASQKSHSQG